MSPTVAHRTVAQKMGVRPGVRTCLIGAPPATRQTMALPRLTEVGDEEADYLHLFVVHADELRASLPVLRDHLAPRGMLWVSWPKGRRLRSDLTLPLVIEVAYDAGLVESTCVAVDDTWSALKLTRPIPDKVYANSFGTLPWQRS